MLLRCGTRTLDLSTPKVMGVLNVTPDSFSDGGNFSSINTAVAQAAKMVRDGAAIIDVGGESTRPGAKPVSLQEELDRVLPVVEKILAELDIIVSVDTSQPEVMAEAAKLGAGLVNDVRALQAPAAVQTVSDIGLPVCLMHMQGEPSNMQNAPTYHQLLDDIYIFLAKRIQQCNQAGIPNQQLLVDPGFGFGKSVEHNYRLLSKLANFKTLGVPVLVGLSRKSMIGAVLDNRPVDGRLAGSVAAAVIAANNGAHILRVHDVAETVDAMKIVAAVKGQES